MKLQTVDIAKLSNIQHNKTISGRKNKQYQQSFKGAGVDFAFNLLDKGFSVLDKNAMIQVSFVDTVSTNIPRTLVDLKTGLAAAFETCRREFSGLFVNCLMPGLVVKGIADMLPKAQELKGTNVAGSWANGAAIDNLSQIYTSAQKADVPNKTREYVQKALCSLEGLDGKSWVKYADKVAAPEFQEAVDGITQAISKSPKERKALLKNAQAKLVGLTKAESILRFNGKPQANLEETIRDITDMGSKFNVVKSKVGTADDKILADAINKYSGSLKKFVNKSITKPIFVIQQF